MTMNSSRLLLACTLILAAIAQAPASIADTGGAQATSEEPAELVVDPQGMSVDISATARDPIRGERSY